MDVLLLGRSVAALRIQVDGRGVVLDYRNQRVG